MEEETVEKSRRTAFDRVDGTTDPADFVRYLDTTRATEYFQEIKRQSLTLLDVREGERAVDVGCGTGDEVLALARLVGPRGQAVGVDASATMLTEARRRAAGAGLRAAFVQADAQRLAFAAASSTAAGPSGSCSTSLTRARRWRSWCAWRGRAPAS